MIIEEREQQAYEVYINLLKSKGFLAETLAIRADFLSKLMPLLADKALLGHAYREVLDQLLLQIDENQWPESLQVAREYYPFWKNDIKAIINITQSDESDALPIAWKPSRVDLAKLWHSVDDEKFSRTDSWALKAYTKAIHEHISDQAQIDIRIKLVKLLLIRINQAPKKDSNAYRIAADATQPLFAMQDNRFLFLIVVREFFQFWAGDPNASTFFHPGSRPLRTPSGTKKP